MKKYDEGYSLVLVLVVLIVLCLVASFILSFSLRNLQAQQAFAQRMQDRYTAAGEIEKIVAQLEALIDAPDGEPVPLENMVYSPEDHTLEITASSGTVQIVCTLLLTEEAVDYNEEDGIYIISQLNGVEYISYQVSTVGGDGE